MFAQTPALTWTGRVLSAIPTVMLLMSGGMKLTLAPEVVTGLGNYGFDPSVIRGIGVVEIAAALLYAVPQTAVLGAILVVGYLGGATAVHVAAGEPPVAPVVIGMLAWAGLALRDERLRKLLPWRA